MPSRQGTPNWVDELPHILTFQWQLIWSVRDECQFVSIVNTPQLKRKRNGSKTTGCRLLTTYCHSDEYTNCTPHLVCKPKYTKVKVPRTPHQLSSFAELCCCCWPIKDLATASLPEYVATHSHQTDYLRPCELDNSVDGINTRGVGVFNETLVKGWVASHDKMYS